jgi:hypothetical protein
VQVIRGIPRICARRCLSTQYTAHLFMSPVWKLEIGGGHEFLESFWTPGTLRHETLSVFHVLTGLTESKDTKFQALFI